MDQLLKNKNIFCQFKDRKLKLIKFKNNVSSTYKTPSFIKNKSSVWLIGYDGAVKYFTSIEKFNFDDIFKIIDGMPMRQNEMEMTNLIAKKLFEYFFHKYIMRDSKRKQENKHIVNHVFICKFNIQKKH